MPKVRPVKRTYKSGGKTKKTQTYYLRYRDPISGKDMLEPTGIRRKDVAEDLAKEKERTLEQIVAGTYDPTEKLRNARYEEALKAFLEYTEVHNAPETLKNYRTSLRHFEQIVKPKSIRAITVSQVDQLISALKKKGYKETTINKHWRQVRAFLKWGEERGYAERVPKIKQLREPENEKFWLPKDDQKKLLSTIADPACDLRFCDADWWGVFTRVLFYSGLRRQSMFGLVWSDIDFREQTMLVQANSIKTKRYHLLPLNRRIRAVLKWWYFKLDRPALSQPVFKIRHEVRRVYDDWMRIVKLAGLEGLCFQDARTTAGTEVAAAVGLGGAQVWLGHSTPVITDKHYANSAPTLRRVADSRDSIE